MPTISRGIDIGVVGEPADAARELGLRLPVRSLAMPADGAGAGRVAWVHRNHGYAGQARLVFDKLSQLREGPPREFGPVLTLEPSPVADTAQVFQGDTARSVFGVLDDGLADPV